MALTLRSNTDLVYVPDHGFVAEEGALRILPQVTRQIRRLNVSHNDLGPAGIATLFKGLTTIRARYSAPETGLGLWGLTEVNVAACGIDDEAMDCILAYAKKDGFLRHVYLQNNDVELRENVDSIVLSLNMSRVETLSLTTNSVDPAGLGKFLGKLNAPYLKELHLAGCRLPPAVAPSIVDYIRSPRSNSLECLLLDGNRLGERGVREIVDIVEEDNFSLLVVGVLANHDYESTPAEEQDDITTGSAEENALLEYQVYTRLPALLRRNRTLTGRIRYAAASSIGPARIILNALRPSDHHTAQRVMEQVSLTGPPLPTFRLLDLPEDIVHLLVRNISGDPSAFSESQFTRLRLEASNRASLRALIIRRQERMRGKSMKDENAILSDLRDQWLEKGNYHRWERNV